jgi:hypothetical protein
MGILEELHEQHKARKKRIKEAAIKEPPPPHPALEEVFPETPLEDVYPRLPFAKFDLVVHEVCAHFGVTVGDLISPRRWPKLTHPRRICIYMLSVLTPFSTAQIARRLRRDPSTASWSLKKVETEIEKHRETIQILDDRIRPLLIERSKRLQGLF